MALRLGWDPIRYLDLEGVEAIVARKVLQVAMDQELEIRRQDHKATEAAVQNGVARAFGGK